MHDETIDVFRKAMKNTMRYMRRNLEGYGLYRGQPKMLFLLMKNDGQTKKELAQKVDVAAPTLTKMVERLEKNAFIYTKKDSEDRRITRVYISDKGRKIVEELKVFQENATQVFFKDMDDDEVSVLKSLLEKINSNIEAQLGKEPSHGSCCPKHAEWATKE